jgi:hypothetical protein
MEFTPAKVNPFQNTPWNGGDVSSWPGAAGIPGESNFLANNQLNEQPDRFPRQVSGLYNE